MVVWTSLLETCRNLVRAAFRHACISADTIVCMQRHFLASLWHSCVHPDSLSSTARPRPTPPPRLQAIPPVLKTRHSQQRFCGFPSVWFWFLHRPLGRFCLCCLRPRLIRSLAFSHSCTSSHSHPSHSPAPHLPLPARYAAHTPTTHAVSSALARRRPSFLFRGPVGGLEFGVGLLWRGVVCVLVPTR
jgi:hypothetical protein